MIATMFLQLLFCSLVAGLGANALKYDHTATAECLSNPHKPHYGGGIVTNPEVNDGLRGWSAFGDAKIEERKSRGNKFIVAHSRNHRNDSVSQKLYLQKDKLYTLSAWIQVSHGNVPVKAVFKTASGFKESGGVIAKANCWSMLKGGLTVDASGPADLFFGSENSSVEIWVDSISLQPFTQKHWKSHQDQNIEKTRKRKVRIQAVDGRGNPISNATISLQQKKAHFPFGTAINRNILNNTAYQNWLAARKFTVTVFENEMKWYANERSPGKEDYADADALLRLAKQHGLDVRGHTVLWEDPSKIQGWASSLSASDLQKAADKRLDSVMSRYKDQVMAWDVVNENLHYSFFENKLGENASAIFYNRAKTADGTTTLFLNEYNTIEESGDGASKPENYLRKLKEIQGFPGNRDLNLGIGLQSHFSHPPDLPYVRAAIDTLASTGFPIWITELDIADSLGEQAQAQYLDQVLRELYAHPKVDGIILWTAWSPSGCYRMCLTDNNFNNLATGNVVDKVLQEWGSKSLVGTTDTVGTFEVSLSHGDYEVNINHPAMASSNFTQRFQVSSAGELEETTLLYRVSA